MAIWSLLPTTYPLSLSQQLPSSSSLSTRFDHIHRVSFSGITYPNLSYSNSTTLISPKSSNYNVQIEVEDEEPDEQIVYRFRREVLRAGILQECKRRMFFETPQDKIKRKTREAAKRNRKRRPYSRTPLRNTNESPKTEIDDDDKEDNWDMTACNAEQQQQTRANLELSNDGNGTATRVRNGIGTAATPGIEQWIPPEQGTYKCNVDAAIFKEQNCFGAGMCIRDHRGNLIRAQTIRTHGNPHPHEAEAWSLKAAIS